MSEGQDERRKASRAAFFEGLEYRVLQLPSPEKLADLDKLLKTESLDLRPGGMGLRLPCFIPPETLLEVRLPVSGQKDPLRVKAKVAWCAGGGSVVGTCQAGLEFIDPTPEIIQAVQDLLKETKSE